MWAELEQEQQEAQLSLEWANCTAYVRRLASDFRTRKESDFPEVTIHYVNAAIENYYQRQCTVIWRRWVVTDECRQKLLCAQNCDQTAANTAYNNTSSPYPTVSSPTLYTTYCLATIHALLTEQTDRHGNTRRTWRVEWVRSCIRTVCCRACTGTCRCEWPTLRSAAVGRPRRSVATAAAARWAEDPDECECDRDDAAMT